MHIFHAERMRGESNFRLKTTLVKSNANSICNDNCNAALGHGYCDLTAASPICLCCPGWSGTTCAVSTGTGDVGLCQDSNNLQAASLYLRDDNCFDTDVAGQQPQGTDSKCSYPDTDTWIDFCYLDNSAISVGAGANGKDIVDDLVFDGICGTTNAYVNATTKTCVPYTDCQPGEYDASSVNTPLK
jgi:hypothetical protein